MITHRFIVVVILVLNEFILLYHFQLFDCISHKMFINKLSFYVRRVTMVIVKFFFFIYKSNEIHWGKLCRSECMYTWIKEKKKTNNRSVSRALLCVLGFSQMFSNWRNRMRGLGNKLEGSRKRTASSQIFIYIYVDLISTNCIDKSSSPFTDLSS